MNGRLADRFHRDPGEREYLGHSRILPNGRRNLVIPQKSVGGVQIVEFSAAEGVV
jgi:hypothetical protein